MESRPGDGSVGYLKANTHGRDQLDRTAGFLVPIDVVAFPISLAQCSTKSAFH